MGDSENRSFLEQQGWQIDSIRSMTEVHAADVASVERQRNKLLKAAHFLLDEVEVGSTVLGSLEGALRDAVDDVEPWAWEKVEDGLGYTYQRREDES